MQYTIEQDRFQRAMRQSRILSIENNWTVDKKVTGNLCGFTEWKLYRQIVILVSRISMNSKDILFFRFGVTLKFLAGYLLSLKGRINLYKNRYTLIALKNMDYANDVFINTKEIKEIEKKNGKKLE